VPREWSHSQQRRDNVVLAMWCACDECHVLLKSYAIDHGKGVPEQPRFSKPSSRWSKDDD